MSEEKRKCQLNEETEKYSKTQCLQHLEISEAMDKCKCIPWYMTYLKKDKAICTRGKAVCFEDRIKNGTIDLPRPIAPPEYEDYSQSINSNKRYTSLYAYGAPAAPPRRTPLLGLGNKTAMRTSGRRPAPAARPPFNRRRTTTSTRRSTTTTTNDLMYYSRNQDYDNYGLEQSAMEASLQPLSNSPSGSPCASGNMKLWSQTYLRGDSVMLRQDTTNLSDVNFDDNLGSLEIRGVCCWILYTEPYFSGQSMTLSAGKYESSTQLVDVFKTASSAKSVVC